ncbi:MAG: hypothetical protein G01um101425_1040 [Candidatus Peregrinibacteria bacterium Gr01-1014_25]|nr:MAG: hypothetical protein G01um101425_1040 [Candidatus Peregrinibacteria bacterium Gr01-1014_25]
MPALTQSWLFPVLLGFIVFMLLEAPTIKEKGKILNHIAAVLASLVTIFGVLDYSYNARCEKQEKLASEIVDLLPKLTQAAINEIGVPDTCRKPDGKPTFYTDESLLKSNLKFDSDTDAYNFKIVPLASVDSEVHAASARFANAMSELVHTCSKDEKYSLDLLFSRGSVANDERTKLTQALAQMVSKCY